MNYRSYRIVFFLALLLMLAGIVHAQDAQDEEATLSADEYIARYENVTFSRTEDGGYVLGEADAPITLVEFADFLCPHCQNYVEDAHQFVDTYVASGEAKFEYRLFPVVNPTLSPLTAQVAECSNEQVEGLFFPVHDYLYDLGEARLVTESVAQDVADTFSLDHEALESCVETAGQYVVDLALGQSVGVTGTPATRLRLPSGELGYIIVEDQVFDRGGLPFNLLEVVMETENFESVVAIPESVLSALVEENEACEADPCWNGLVPGETDWETVTTFIEDKTDFMEVQLLSPEDPTNPIRGISWFGLGAQVQQPNQAVTLDGEMLDFIILTEISPYTLGDVLEAKGEPSFALANVLDANFTIVDVFYPDNSLIVQVLVDASVGMFSQESQIIGAQYLSPAQMEEFLATNELPEWGGVEEIESYIQ